ncbi:MAG: aromatic ring-hydroxylating dioxygenase subunit alpha [Alphaproteobacteria bacterium]
MSATDIFASEHFRRVRQPVSEAEGLPAWCYTSEAWLAAERGRLFRPHWACVGRADQIAAPGDYMVRSVAGASLIVLRDRDGAVRAFANTCRHRGAELLEGDGHCRAIKCPYHSWVYGLDGTLTGAPEMEETRDFDRGRFGLIPVRLESWANFLFVNLDGKGPSLAAHLGDCPALHAPWSLDEMVATRRRVFEVACNWKLFIDVFMEGYHLQSVHATSLAASYGAVDPPEPVTGEYSTLFTLNLGTVTLLQNSNRKALPPVPGLTGRNATGTRYTLVFPNFMFAATTDCMWFFEVEPLAPDRTRVGMVSCFPRSTAARADFAELVKGYYERWDVAIEEDNAVLALQQRGLSSPFARPGRYSSQEFIVSRFAAWIAEKMAGAASA